MDNIKTTELNERALLNALEVLKMEEPELMTTYLWCKIQTMAESLLALEEKRLMERDLMINMEIYRSIKSKRQFDRRVMKMLVHQN